MFDLLEHDLYVWGYLIRPSFAWMPSLSDCVYIMKWWYIKSKLSSEFRLRA